MTVENIKKYGADIDAAFENFDYDEERIASAARALTKNKNYFEMLDLIKIKSYDSVFTKTHNFKGSCAKLGLAKLCSLCDSLLDAASERNEALCAERAAALSAEFEKYVTAVNEQ